MLLYSLNQWNFVQGFIFCLAGLRKSQRQMSGMQTLLRQTDISKSLDKFPVKYDHNPREVGHNST